MSNMAHSMTQAPAVSVISAPAITTKAPALFAALFGLAILYVVGFAQPAMLHNAAHDTRHATAFPCH